MRILKLGRLLVETWKWQAALVVALAAIGLVLAFAVGDSGGENGSQSLADANGVHAGIGSSEVPRSVALTPHEDAGPPNAVAVHGHWTIEVRDPDGTLVRHVEFDNAFVGGATLARLMARSDAIGWWQIQLAASSNNDQPCLAGSTPGTCFIDEATWPGGTAEYRFRNMTLAATGSTLRLSGSATAMRSGAISRVVTYLTTCPTSSTAAAPCSTENQQSFTDANISPVSVASGQNVDVTVDITFS